MPTLGPRLVGRPAFSLWALPGTKILFADGPAELQLSTVAGTDAYALTLDNRLTDGDDFAFLIPAAMALGEAQRVMSYVRSSSASSETAAPADHTPYVNRTAIVHLRALQSLDAIRAGASHRLIARVLFGADEVLRRWTPDGELRAQVRYVIRRGENLSNGGYRSLLSGGL